MQAKKPPCLPFEGILLVKTSRGPMELTPGGFGKGSPLYGQSKPKAPLKSTPGHGAELGGQALGPGYGSLLDPSVTTRTVAASCPPPIVCPAPRPWVLSIVRLPCAAGHSADDLLVRFSKNSAR